MLRLVGLALVLASCGGGDSATDACQIFVDCGDSSSVAACEAELENCAETAVDAYLDCLDQCVASYADDASCASFGTCEDDCWGDAGC